MDCLNLSLSEDLPLSTNSILIVILLPAVRLGKYMSSALELQITRTRTVRSKHHTESMSDVGRIGGSISSIDVKYSRHGTPRVRRSVPSRAGVFQMKNWRETTWVENWKS